MHFYRLSLNQLVTTADRLRIVGRCAAAAALIGFWCCLWFWFDWRWLATTVAASAIAVWTGWLIVDIGVEYQRRVDARRWDYTHRN